MSWKEGDMVTPIPLWNKSERYERQLHVPTRVLEVDEEAHSESGLMFRVRFKGGRESWLDSRWFKECGRGC